MNLGVARLFKDIAQSRSITRAAVLNGITQSAASQQLNEVERALGVVLVDRGTRPLNLTPAGRLYYELCKDLLRRTGEFEVALERLKGKVEGEVRVASIYSVGLSEMAHLEEEFRRRYPAAVLRVDYLRPEKVYEAVLEEKAEPCPSRVRRCRPCFQQARRTSISPGQPPLWVAT